MLLVFSLFFVLTMQLCPLEQEDTGQTQCVILPLPLLWSAADALPPPLGPRTCSTLGPSPSPSRLPVAKQSGTELVSNKAPIQKIKQKPEN